MDAIDYRIIRELQRDGRQANIELAAAVGLSPSPCLRRVKNLEAERMILGYAAIIDQARYGYPINVFVSLRLDRQDDATIQRVERELQRLDEVVECYLMTGSRDYLLRIVSDSLDGYEAFVRRKLATIPGISNIESSFALGQVKRPGVFPVLALSSR